MDLYRYVIKERQRDGSVWTSPEVFEGDIRHVRQNVTQGFTSGARWAETSADSFNPHFFLFGLNRFGRESNSDPDFTE